MSNTGLLAAVVVIGRKTGKGDSLLPCDPPDLRQAHQDRHGGRQSDAIDAVDQSKPPGEVGVFADRGMPLQAVGARFVGFCRSAARIRSGVQ